ncbi:hypothetical protein [Parasulfitobacter algicola]|uniref:Uncharacterized protein n=1 Tax=Parasulfitobacter algicola TaxID=2614809 RepID=A0ABX2IUD0_9RHOB|nr:hypothetical protein [Sulfitobacter algicola]NSX55616.1 hypothetical protein [Sulfitobacter algicola]
MAAAWMSRWTKADLIYFDAQDVKLLVLLLVIALCLIGWIFWPRLFRNDPKMKTRQILTLSFAITGIVGFIKVMFASGYLTTAAAYAIENGYVICNPDRYQIFGELWMAKDQQDCASVL